MEPSQISTLAEVFSLGKIIASVLVLILAWLSVRAAIFVLEAFSEKSSRSRLAVKKLIPIVRISIWIFGIYVVILGVFQPRAEAFFAIAASAGIAIGFASQDILKNIFGGIVIVMDRPFQVGDVIQLGDHYGEVVSIGLRSTRIVTRDDSTITIPNAAVVSQSVSNANSGALDFQVVVDILLPAIADVQLIKRIAWETAVTSPYIFLDKPVAVRIADDFKETYLTRVRIKAYVLDNRLENAFASDIVERAKAAYLGTYLAAKDYALTTQPSVDRRLLEGPLNQGQGFSIPSPQ